MNHSSAPLHLLRESVLALRAYTPGEQVNECIKLNTNECAWPPSPRVLACLADLASDRLRLYPDPLSRALRERASRLWGHPLEGILAGNGSDDCLTIIYRSILRPGDRVAVPWPTYGLYDTLAGIQDVEMQHCPWEDSWGLPTAALLAAQARLVLLANPNNPSATLVPLAQIDALAAALQGVLVVDEAYIDYAGSAASAIPLLARHRNLLILRTCSKSYALAGARLGFCLGDPALIAQMLKVKDSYNINAITQAIGWAALDDEAYHRQLVEDTCRSRAQLCAQLALRGWRWPESAANFLLCRVGAEAGTLYRGLKEQGILLRWWESPELAQDLRITVGTPDQQDRLLAALDRLCHG